MVLMIYVLIFVSSAVSNQRFHSRKILKNVFRRRKNLSISDVCSSHQSQLVRDKIQLRALQLLFKTHRKMQQSKMFFFFLLTFTYAPFTLLDIFTCQTKSDYFEDVALKLLIRCSFKK